MSALMVRKASVDDAEAIAPLFDAYRRFYEQPADLEGALLFISARLEARESVIFVAERDSELVGFTQLYPSFSSASMKRVWILNDLFVVPTDRREGIGQALMNAAEQLAREDGSKGLVLATKKTNAPAKALYERRQWTIDAVFDHYSRFF